MTKTVIGNIQFDYNNTESSGGVANQLIEIGEAIRLVTYYDAELDETSDFIANLHPSVPLRSLSISTVCGGILIQCLVPIRINSGKSMRGQKGFAEALLRHC